MDLGRFERLYLMGDEDGGVDLYCRDCADQAGGTGMVDSLAYYGWRDRADTLVVKTLPELLAAGLTHQVERH